MVMIFRQQDYLREFLPYHGGASVGGVVVYHYDFRFNFLLLKESLKTVAKEISGIPVNNHNADPHGDGYFTNNELGCPRFLVSWRTIDGTGRLVNGGEEV